MDRPCEGEIKDYLYNTCTILQERSSWFPMVQCSYLHTSMPCHVHVECDRVPSQFANYPIASEQGLWACSCWPYIVNFPILRVDCRPFIIEDEPACWDKICRWRTSMHPPKIQFSCTYQHKNAPAIIYQKELPWHYVSVSKTLKLIHECMTYVHFFLI